MAIAQNQAVIEPKLLICRYEKRPFCRMKAVLRKMTQLMISR